MTAQALLEAVPSLEKNHDLLMKMLMRPDDFTLAALRCSVRAFLERNGGGHHAGSSAHEAGGYGSRAAAQLSIAHKWGRRV